MSNIAERRLRGARPVNRWFYHFLSVTIRGLLRHVFRLQPVNAGVIPRRGAAILVANHVNFFDPIWIYDVIPRPIYFVATEELFRGWFVNALVRFFGTFPKRKASGDFKSIRSLMSILKQGNIVGIFPEGERTWDGTNTPMIPTIARLIRRVKVPVYACRLEGGYLSWPRWADRWRRIPVRMVFSRVFAPEEIPDSDERVLEEIGGVIRTRDYELPIRERRWFSGLAAGVYKVVYRCPDCGTVEGLRAVHPPATNRVECRSCSASWKVDIGSRLTPVDENGAAIGESRTVAELYRSIRSLPLPAIRSSLLPLEEGETLYLVSRPHLLFWERRFPHLRIHGLGRAFLTDRRLLFRGQAAVRLSAPLQELDSLTIEPGDKLHFRYAGVLYRIPFRGESPVKWLDFITRLLEEARPRG